MQFKPEFQLITSTPQYFSFTDAASVCCVFFTAPWCFRCKQVEEKVQGFPSDYPQVAFLKVDLEDNEELGELLDIRTLPTFVLVRKGSEVHRVEGVPQQRPARKLAQAIRQHLLEEEAESAAAPAAGAVQGQQQ